MLDFIADSTSTKDFENLELTDLQQKVRQAIADLPENNGELVRLYYLRGVTYDNIAAAKEKVKAKYKPIYTRACHYCVKTGVCKAFTEN